MGNISSKSPKVSKGPLHKLFASVSKSPQSDDPPEPSPNRGGAARVTILLSLLRRPSLCDSVKGEVTYNGYKLDEFVPKKTSAYISQNDVHIGEMTVKETLDFSARCQGVGTRYDFMSELARREKDAGILPEAEVDLFMKATAMKGVESSLITDYILKWLAVCF